MPRFNLIRGETKVLYKGGGSVLVCVSNEGPATIDVVDDAGPNDSPDLAPLNSIYIQSSDPQIRVSSTSGPDTTTGTFEIFPS